MTTKAETEQTERILFTSPNCPRCKMVRRDALVREFPGLREVDVSTREGLVEVTFYGVTGRLLPMIIERHGDKIRVAEGVLPTTTRRDLGPEYSLK